MNRGINIGVIGLGFGQAIAQVFKAVDHRCGVYLSSRDFEKAAWLAREIGADGAYRTWQELAADPKIDLVVIASPNTLHHEMFEFAFKQGKNILLEKPAATTSKDIEAMEKLASGSGRLVVVNHEARLSPVVLHLKESIESGQLGKILTVRIGAYLNWLSRPDFTGHWNLSKAAGGGQLLIMGVHLIDLGRYLLRMCGIISGDLQVQVVADARFEDEADAETQFSGHFLTEGGASLQLFNDSYCFGYKDFIVEVIGDRGMALYSDTRGLCSSFANSQPPQEVKVDDPLPEIKFGNSLLTRSLKFVAQSLLESTKSGKVDSRLCTLSQAKENLSYLEKYRRGSLEGLSLLKR